MFPVILWLFHVMQIKMNLNHDQEQTDRDDSIWIGSYTVITGNTSYRHILQTLK